MEYYYDNMVEKSYKKMEDDILDKMMKLSIGMVGLGLIMIALTGIGLALGF